MDMPRKKIDFASISWNTGHAKRYCNSIIELANSIQTDSRKKERIEKQECKNCFYPSRVSSACCSNRDCGICGKQIFSGCGDVNVLCKSCAKEFDLCAHCGGDIEMKNRRNRKELMIFIGSAIGKSESNFNERIARLQNVY